MDLYKIGIPPGTRLMSLMRGARGNLHGWMVWTAINNSALNPSQWLGTYMFCGDDGSVIRVTIREDGSEDDYYIKQPDSNS